MPEDSRFCETVEKLRIVVDRMSAFESTLERQLVERLCDIFGAAGRTENDLDEAVRRWFNNLSEFTRTHAFGGRQKALIDAASKSGTISERFFRSLATEMRLRRVEDWESNLSDEYVAAVKEAKREIEEYDPIGSKLGNESNEHPANGGNDVVENAVAIIRKLIVEELRLDRAQISELIQRLKEEFA